MHSFRYSQNRLHCEAVSLANLVKRFGTPLYVYSQATLTDHYTKLDRSFAPLDRLICFAMKSNSNLAVIRALADLGSGFDTVSGGEIQRVIAAGGDPRKCVFAGVGKTEQEIAFALRQGIYSFNFESEAELKRISQVAVKLKKIAPVAARVNPNVDAGTHAKITTGTYANKFGIAFEQIEGVYARAAKLPNLRLRGLQMHIGSQLTDVQPFRLAVERVAPLVKKLSHKYGFDFFSVGGGIGIVYQPALESGDPQWWRQPDAQKILTPQAYADTLVPLLRPLGLKILFEPGRFLTGNAGALVTRVEYIKHTGKKHFVIVDAAMNDLIRPAFYDSYHEIVPVIRQRGAVVPSDVVGPICESGDYFAKDRPLAKVREGDYLALLSAGAYGSVMSSNYNSRPLTAEVLVNGRRVALVRQRQKVRDIWAGESCAPWQASARS
ncbi:MAG TPA: diaminopimelate decarboxylase [Verrucomicrobiota bacterium]|nr:diaminopimelate decarboxylase [Verrucomicrobiales bacterium]HRI13579.1 diaminopimelate decarboxylase [Verrucomicrobiota bacterium]